MRVGASDDLHRPLLDDVGPRGGRTSGGSGACSTSATAASTPRASGSRASGSGTPTSSTCSRRARSTRGAAAPRRLRPRPARARVPGGLVPRPRDERRRAADERRGALFGAAAELPAHHIKVGNLTGTECELPRIVERYGELCADAARYTDAQDPLRVHAVRRQRERRRHGARGRRRRGRPERRARARHLAPGQAQARAGRPPPHPAAVPVLGRAQRRPLRVRARTGSTR